MSNLVMLHQRMYAQIEGSPKFGSASLYAPLLAVGARGSSLLEIRILPNLVLLGQTVRTLLSRSAWKKLTPRIPLFEVSQGHLNRHGSIRHLWLNSY